MPFRLTVFIAVLVLIARGDETNALLTTAALTNRQREVLLSVAHSQTSEQIAANLNISVSVVKQHITAACEKLGASSRADATAIALHKHLLDA